VGGGGVPTNPCFCFFAKWEQGHDHTFQVSLGASNVYMTCSGTLLATLLLLLMQSFLLCTKSKNSGGHR
jgi:hypothetical protein